MLIAVTLTLVSPTAVTLPRQLGRASYAAALACLHDLDPALAALAHDGDGPKPLTCSELLNAPGRRDGTPIEAGKPYFLRLTGLTEAVSNGLAEALIARRPQLWELDRHVFTVTDVVCDAAQDGWSGQTTYEQLVAERMLGGSVPERGVMLRFAAPTAFRSQGMHVPVPLPGLVFGSLVDRWNAFSPVGLSPDARRFGSEMVALSRYRLVSRPVVHKDGALRMGGVGYAAYHSLSRDRYWLAVMHLLADFARFSGVGVQTTTGMGQVRRMRPAAPSGGSGR